jgi:hypothetical protein
MEDVEARFAHLLQPIRDLTKNWEVDVAAQLGEYLEEVRAEREWQGRGLHGCLGSVAIWPFGCPYLRLFPQLLPCFSKSPLVGLAWACHCRSLPVTQP